MGAEHEVNEGDVVAMTLPPDPHIDQQVVTAKRFPRSVSKFREEVLSLATLSKEVAEQCIYALPRGGKKIRGANVRFSEIALFAWGNCRVDAGIVDVGDTHVTGEATFIDVERNAAIRVRVQRRITDSDGNRYNDDMVGVTGNACVSVARRNVVLAGIPRALWADLYEQVRKVALGEAGALAENRQRWMDWYAKAGIPEDQVCKILEVDGVEDIGLDELEVLIGISNALQGGEISVESLVADAQTEAPRRGLSLNERLARLKGADQDMARRAVALKGERDALVAEGEALLAAQLSAGTVTPEQMVQGLGWLKDGSRAIDKLRAKVEGWRKKAPETAQDAREPTPASTPAPDVSAPPGPQAAAEPPGMAEFEEAETTPIGNAGAAKLLNYCTQFSVDPANVLAAVQSQMGAQDFEELTEPQAKVVRQMIQESAAKAQKRGRK